MAGGGPVPSEPLLTVLVSARAWLEEAGSGRESVHLQLSVEPERAGDFRLSVRRNQAGARGPTGAVLGDFHLRDVRYEQKTLRIHELSSALGTPGRLLTFLFDDEREAQKWWTVVSSSLREAQKVALTQVNVLGLKPPIADKPRPSPDAIISPSKEEEPLINLCTKEDLAARLSRSIEAGDPLLSAQYATELARQKVPVQVQLKPICYPKSEICMKVGVEDASASVNISTYVSAHTTIAVLKQQIFREYQFHPSIQRWIIGQCLCSDDRTVGSYGIRKDGDTAFLYLLGAKQAKMTPQDPYTSGSYQPFPLMPNWDERKKFSTMPARPSAKNGVLPNFRPEKMEHPNLDLDIQPPKLMQKPPMPAAPPSPAQWMELLGPNANPHRVLFTQLIGSFRYGGPAGPALSAPSSISPPGPAVRCAALTAPPTMWCQKNINRMRGSSGGSSRRRTATSNTKREKEEEKRRPRPRTIPALTPWKNSSYYSKDVTPMGAELGAGSVTRVSLLPLDSYLCPGSAAPCVLAGEPCSAVWGGGGGQSSDQEDFTEELSLFGLLPNR